MVYQKTFLYLRYSLFEWGFPAMVILICLALEFIPDERLIHYSKTGQCWLSSFYAKLAAYTISFSLTTSACFILTITVIIYTRQEKEKNHKMLAKES